MGKLKRRQFDALCKSVERCLGSGALGAAYLVHAMGQRSVLKVFHCQMFGSRDMKIERRFLKAVDGAGGAPRVLGYSKKRPALQMTFVEGDLLSAVMARALPAQVHLQTCLRLADAASEVHLKGVAHCDIKADNVIVGRDAEGLPGQVHLIDFGFAATIGERFPSRATAPTNRRPFHCACFYEEGIVTSGCDVLSLGFAFEQWSGALRPPALARALRELAQRMQLPQHHLRPSLAQVMQSISSLVRRAEAGEEEDPEEDSSGGLWRFGGQGAAKRKWSPGGDDPTGKRYKWAPPGTNKYAGC